MMMKLLLNIDNLTRKINGFCTKCHFGIFCTLATCKPQIREHALKGDWVAGFGSAHTEIAKKMVFFNAG